jgi:hypothetical protein
MNWKDVKGNGHWLIEVTIPEHASRAGENNKIPQSR